MDQQPHRLGDCGEGEERSVLIFSSLPHLNGKWDVAGQLCPLDNHDINFAASMCSTMETEMNQDASLQL